MDTQPYDLRNGWVVNADTGLPIARLDHDQNGNSIFVVPGCGAITIGNIEHIVSQVKYVNDTITMMHDGPLYPRCEDCGYKHSTSQSCPMYTEPPNWRETDGVLCENGIPIHEPVRDRY